MIPTTVNAQVPVPPPAYYRAQARLSPALHIDALTLVNALHLLTLCCLAVRLAHHRCPPPLPCLAGVAHLGHTARSPCCSSRSYARCGGSPTLICVTGYARGPLSPWHAVYRSIGTAIPAFRVHLNSANVGSREMHRCLKRFSRRVRTGCYPSSAHWRTRSDY